MRARGRMVTTLLLLSLGVTACNEASGRETRYAVSGGDADRGKAAIEMYGCGSCHTIPGVRDANGLVGPPLMMWSRRTYIAGEVPNTPDFLVRWIEMPQAIEPGTAMPNLGVTEGRARDIAAYLYTIK
ncbi:MAG: c-type cytochrome [Gemmatimonadaceae bacterium]